MLEVFAVAEELFTVNLLQLDYFRGIQICIPSQRTLHDDTKLRGYFRVPKGSILVYSKRLFFQLLDADMNLSVLCVG